ncbi:MAG: hypothetical protein DMF72_10320 [Acidobacteria bacterium]|nr:MAG: hypothetical protein DMF72_10320 [Acidobacteriota bacterium]
MEDPEKTNKQRGVCSLPFALCSLLFALRSSLFAFLCVLCGKKLHPCERADRPRFASTMAAVRAALIASLYSPAAAALRMERTSLIMRRLSRE